MLEKQTVRDVALALRDTSGREVCGFILRHPNEKQEFVRARNWAMLPTSFEIGSTEVLRIKRYAQKQGTSIEAFLHSHSSTLALSTKDRSSMGFSEVPWIVVALIGNFFRYRVFTQDNGQETFEVDLTDCW